VSPLRNHYFCHKNTKTQNLTKIDSLNFSFLCNLKSWRFGGIFYSLIFQNGFKNKNGKVLFFLISVFVIDKLSNETLNFSYFW